MIDFVDGLNQLSSGWADAMLRASWQGGLAVVLVWSLCRLVPRIPTHLQCWLWRAIYLKILLAVLLPSSLRLSLLPAPAVPEIPPVRFVGAAAPERAPVRSVRQARLPRAGVVAPARSASRPSGTTWLLLVWGLGLLAV